MVCTLVNTVQIEESAKRPIEGASSGSAILKLYNKWYNMLEEERASTTALSNTDSKKTLFGKVKASIQGKEKGTVCLMEVERKGEGGLFCVDNKAI